MGRGTVEELLWSNGVRWTRQPLGVHGTWFDQRNALLTVSITGDKVLIVDSAALVVAAGTAMGKPMSSMTVTFVNGVQAVASVSADGSALNWSYREQWSRIPAAAAESDSLLASVGRLTDQTRRGADDGAFPMIERKSETVKQ